MADGAEVAGIIIRHFKGTREPACSHRCEAQAENLQGEHRIMQGRIQS